MARSRFTGKSGQGKNKGYFIDNQISENVLERNLLYTENISNFAVNR